MDEFRKPYEYTEDKRGAILYFVIMLISLDAILGVMYTVQVSRVFSQIPILYYCSLVVNILYFLFILFTAVTCFKMKKNLVTISKIYLIVRAVYSTISAFIVYFHAVNDKGMTGARKQYDDMNRLTVQVLIVPLIFVFFISILWYLYFTKSKRCKEIAKGSLQQ